MKQENTILNKANENKAVSSNEIVDHDFVTEVATENKLAKHAIQVHKFGGSSLATPKCIKRALEIIRENCQLNDIVVVSANGKTTDRLFALYSLVEEAMAEQTVQTSDELTQAIEDLAQEQATLITELLNANNTKQLLLRLNKDIAQLTTWLSADIVEHHNDILALGEVWSARLLSALLNEQVCPSNSIDSRDFLVIDNEQSCVVDTALSAVQLRERRQFGKLAVITGYISKDTRGKSCTLGRNGSDYSATIIASLVAAGNVTLWTDVDGIYSADPRVVPSARKLHRLPNGVANFAAIDQPIK